MSYDQTRRVPQIMVEAPDSRAEVTFLVPGGAVTVTLELDAPAGELRAVTKVMEDGQSMWLQDEHTVRMEFPVCT
jgi:hypothetical protein